MIGRIPASGLSDANYSGVKIPPMANASRQAHHWSHGTMGESTLILVEVHLSTVC